MQLSTVAELVHREEVDMYTHIFSRWGVILSRARGAASATRVMQYVCNNVGFVSMTREASDSMHSHELEFTWRCCVS
jgi:hypothetical protein